jgi:RNA polymerase sigma-70 factor (ECF subfamily)
MSKQDDQAILMNKIRDNERIIYKICNSYCSNKNDREYLAQEIIYQLLKSYHSFSDQYRFSTWMYRVALNVAISFYRKNKTQKIFHDEIKSDPKEEIGHSSVLWPEMKIYFSFFLKDLSGEVIIF